MTEALKLALVGMAGGVPGGAITGCYQHALDNL